MYACETKAIYYSPKEQLKFILEKSSISHILLQSFIEVLTTSSGRYWIVLRDIFDEKIIFPLGERVTNTAPSLVLDFEFNS